MIMQLYAIVLFFFVPIYTWISPKISQTKHFLNIINIFFVPDLSPMTTARKATPSEDPVECGGTSPLRKPVKMAVRL